MDHRRTVELLGRLIEASHRSQASVAREVGVRPSHLNHFLKGHGDIRAAKFLDILAALDIDLEALLEERLSERRPAESDGQRWLRLFRGLDAAERGSFGRLLERMSWERRRLALTPRRRGEPC